MPMDRSLYPKNWDEIATARKQAANWTCEWCGRPCRRELKAERLGRLSPPLEVQP